MLTDDIKQSIDESVLCWLATADVQGEPNCSPKEIFTYFGNTVIIANIASPQSVRNVQANRAVSVSFIHVFKQKGFQLKGTAHYLDAKDQACDEPLALLQKMAGDAFVIQGVFIIEPVSVKPIIAPGYFLVPGTTEASQIASAKKTYGV